MSKLNTLVSLSPLVASFLLAGCVANTSPTALPSGAASASGDALPAGFTATNPETGLPVTQTDWDQWQNDGRLLTYNPDGGAANNSAAAAQLSQAQAFTSIVTATNPLLAAALADPDSSDATTTKLFDGNFLHTVTVKNSSANLSGANLSPKVTVMTLGNTSKTLIMGNAAARFIGDPALVLKNQVTLYTRFYNQAKLINPQELSRYKMPDPSTLSAMTLVEVQGLVARFGPIASIYSQYPVPTSTSRPPTASLEYGSGTLNQKQIGDRTSDGCGNYDYTDSSTQQSYPSIYNRYNWPMKPWDTSVKQQGTRGSCVAFGINGAMEADIAQNHGYWMNLSEQDLYYHMKGYWFPIGDSYGDGSDTHGVFDQMASFAWTDPVCAEGGGKNCEHNTVYHIPLEKQWEYNPSLSRTEDPTTCGQPDQPACKRIYTQSCINGYDPDPTHPQDYCSETNHQGSPICFDALGFNWCGYLTSVAQNAATQGAPTQSEAKGAMGQPYYATGDAELWDSSNPDQTIAMMTWAMIFRSPLIAGISVTPSWDGNTNGYITYNGSNEKNRGGHAVEVTGYIDNSQLPQGAPQGSGGGYFIIKNSWGTCFGDGGYVYAPVDWIKAYSYSMVVLNGIN